MEIFAHMYNERGKQMHKKSVKNISTHTTAYFITLYTGLDNLTFFAAKTGSDGHRGPLKWEAL